MAQLKHKRDSLPEIAAQADLQAQLERSRNQHIAAGVILSDLQRDQARSDADVEVVRQRIAKDQEMLDSGSINDPKQLTNLQHELESLARRRTDLEDVELEIMERVEGAEAAVTVLADQSSVLASELEKVSESLSSQVSALNADIAEVQAERDRISADMPSELMALYEKIRTGHDGVGAAKLHRAQCEGCRMTLPPQELQAIRQAPADLVVQCEECRRILVRTADSGL